VPQHGLALVSSMSMPVERNGDLLSLFKFCLLSSLRVVFYSYRNHPDGVSSAANCYELMTNSSTPTVIENGNHEAAHKVLKRVHHSTNNSSDAFVEKEFLQIQNQLEYERTLPSSWKSIATVPQYRKRAFLGFGTLFTGQMTGTLVLNNYGPTLYASLGYGPGIALVITGAWISWGFFMNIVNAILLDIFGRKWLMTFGLLGCAVSLLGEIIMLALYEGTTNRGGNIAAVFFIFLHLGFYGSCVDASTYVYASEIWPTHLRAKGFALSISGLFVGSLILLVSAPTGFANIKGNFYIVMLIWTFLAAFVFARFFPEVGC
jgi:hypothetical protein